MTSSPVESSALESYKARTGFVIELAARLHMYGTTAQRLEGAVEAVARRLGLRCNPWSNPTGMILSFSDVQARTPTVGAGAADASDLAPLLDNTQVIRLAPGSTDLRKLCAADAIAEDVLAGRTQLNAGAKALLALDRPPGWRALALETLSYGLSGASVAALLRSSWADIAASGTIGMLIGLLHLLGIFKPRMQEAEDALAALIATFLAAAAATFWMPLSTRSVVIAAIIVLIPGLSLTTAVAELSSQHLVSGTARFGGALVSLLKLVFGTAAATQCVRLLGWHPHEALARQGPAWLEWIGLVVCAYAFAVLFRANRRDYPLVMAAACLGYGVTRWTGEAFGNDAGVFFGSMAVGVAANAYARWAHRPGALIRVPGIILLVPGSVGFRSLTLVAERDLMLGLSTADAVVNALIALVAGMLFGNLLIPARRNL